MSSTPVDNKRVVDVAVIGAGIVGIACAWYLAHRRPEIRIALIDPLAPMSVTSAASGENYRSMWPRQEIGALTRRSIELMEDVVGATDNRINMTRRGYLYVSRADNPDVFINDLQTEYAHSEAGNLRVHTNASTGYAFNDTVFQPDNGIDGLDVLSGSDVVQRVFGHLAADLTVAVHARRAGDISSQQLGQYFLECLGEHALTRVTGQVNEISQSEAGFVLKLDTGENVYCENVVNAAGPAAAAIADLGGYPLPLKCVAQQKIAFIDRIKAVPRDAPFVIDLDGHMIDWPSETRDALTDDPNTRWLTEAFPGGIHCRPDGGDHGNRIKLGWAFNQTAHENAYDSSQPVPLLDHFPELVVRGAARATPSLTPYIEQLPAHVTHYGGYYTKTDENWPIIGPAGIDGAFVAAGLSGYGTMAACATGELIASWICGDTIDPHLRRLSLERYNDETLMAELRAQASTGEL